MKIKTLNEFKNYLENYFKNRSANYFAQIEFVTYQDFDADFMDEKEQKIWDLQNEIATKYDYYNYICKNGESYFIKNTKEAFLEFEADFKEQCDKEFYNKLNSL